MGGGAFCHNGWLRHDTAVGWAQRSDPHAARPAVRRDVGCVQRAGEPVSFYVLVVVLIGMAFYEIARGQDAQPYGLVCLVGGASYIGVLIWLRIRS